MSYTINRVGGGGGSGEGASILVTGLAHSVLPSGYTELEYIQNNRYYNDCNIPLTTNWSQLTKIEMGVKVITPASSSYDNLVCCSAGRNAPYFCTGGEVSGITKTSYSYTNNVLTIEFTSSSTSTLTMAGWSDTYYCGVYQYLYFIGFNGTTEMFHLIPCKRDSDSAIGMYDLVSQTFFGNAGSGTFSAGAEVHSSSVTATKGSKTVNGVWGATIENPEWRGLPSGYTQVKWIRGDGNAYINTGVALSFPLSASIKFKFNALNSSADVLCGSEQTNKANTIFGSNPSFKFYTQFQYDYPRFTIGRDTTTTHYATTNANATTIQTTLDDTTLSVTTTNVLSSLPVYLFAYNNQGTAQYISQADIELFTLTLNNTLTCDYVPCKNSSNEYGMYDMVTGTFFGNSGTGSFTGGEEVPQFISAEGYLITPLTEYGEWAVSATDGTHSASQTVTVDMLMMYEIEMGYKIDTDFSSQGNWREVGGTFAYTSGGIQFAVGSETGTQTFMSGFNGQYIEHDINLEEWDMTLTNNVYGTNAQYGGIAVQLVDSSNNPIVSIYRGDGYGGTSNYNYFKLFDSSFSQLQYTQVSGINNVSLTMSMTYHSGTLVAKYNSTQIYSASHTLNDVAKVRVWFIHETGYSNPLEVASHLIVE